LGDGDAPRFISIPIHDSDTRTLRTFLVVLSNLTGGASLGTTADEPAVAKVETVPVSSVPPDGRRWMSLARTGELSSGPFGGMDCRCRLLLIALRFEAFSKRV
jgi:hypothetical protein